MIPPAAYLAHSKGTFTLTGIVIAGTVGSWVGASVMYWASYLIGRPLLMKYGRYVMLTPEKIQQAEACCMTAWSVCSSPACSPSSVT